MIKIENHLGIIEISQEYFANLIGNAVSSCFGVSEMVSSGAKQGLRDVFFKKNDAADKGVRVHSENGQLVVDLHIVVTHGLNIPAIVKSIVNKVRYTVEDATGLSVKKVNMFVDGIKSE